MTEPTSAGFLLKNIIALIASALGALVSLRFIKRPNDKRGLALILDNTFYFLSGFCCSLFLAPVVHEYLVLSDTAIPAVHFMLGLFGMSIAFQINENIVPVFKKFFGTKNEGEAQ